MSFSEKIILIQRILRGWFKGIIKENGAIIVVMLNTALVSLAQEGRAISRVTILQVILNTLFYFVWVDFNYKLAFKALVAGGVSHIFTVSLIAFYMGYIMGFGKRYDLPVYIEGYFNQVTVLIVFAISLIWIFSGNKNQSSIELNNDNLIDKDFYG